MSTYSVCIKSEVAQGATSFVYKAEDTTSGQVFALKKIICQSEEQRRMAKHEVQLHNVFKHSNIMPLVDHAEVTAGSLCHEFYLLFPYMQVILSSQGLHYRFFDKHFSYRKEHCEIKSTFLLSKASVCSLFFGIEAFINIHDAGKIYLYPSDGSWIAFSSYVKPLPSFISTRPLWLIGI